MRQEPDVFVTLATRIPQSLHRRLKLHCLETDRTQMEFVIAALTEQLKRKQPRRPAS